MWATGTARMVSSAAAGTTPRTVLYIMRFVRFAATALLLCGCEPFVVVDGSNSESVVLQEQSNVGYVKDPDDRLRRAAFQLLEGKTRDEAIVFLQEDGFSCKIYTCETFVSRRERFKYGLAPVGPLRILTRRYILIISDSHVTFLSSIDARVTGQSENIGE